MMSQKKNKRVSKHNILTGAAYDFAEACVTCAPHYKYLLSRQSLLLLKVCTDQPSFQLFTCKSLHYILNVRTKYYDQILLFLFHISSGILMQSAS